jgi:hypothetical protein
VSGHSKDNKDACNACRGNDLMISINSEEVPFVTVFAGSYVLSPIIGSFLDDK